MPNGEPSMADLGIDPEVETRLFPHLDSFAKWELIRFLHDNPFTVATVEELARYLGRDEMDLRPAAHAMAGAGILSQVDRGAEYVYALTRDQDIQRLIGRLVERHMADPLVRLAISAQILRRHRYAKLQSATR